MPLREMLCWHITRYSALWWCQRRGPCKSVLSGRLFLCTSHAGVPVPSLVWWTLLLVSLFRGFPPARLLNKTSWKLESQDSSLVRAIRWAARSMVWPCVHLLRKQRCSRKTLAVFYLPPPCQQHTLLKKNPLISAEKCSLQSAFCLHSSLDFHKDQARGLLSPERRGLFKELGRTHWERMPPWTGSPVALVGIVVKCEAIGMSPKPQI